MSLVLGKSSIKQLSKVIELYEPLDNGRKKKAGKIRVTVEVLPRAEFQDFWTSHTYLEVAERLIKNIESADDSTQVPEFDTSLVSDIYDIEWQWTPIYQWIIEANDPAIARVLAAKN